MTEYEKELERTIEDLKYIIRNKNDRISDLEDEKNKLSDKLYDADWKIKTELDPRIEREKRSYDNWVLSGGSNDCMQNGINGNCGVNCSAFGSEPECTDDLEDETLLEYYVENDVVADILFERGLWWDKLKIDWKEDWRSILKDMKFWGIGH